MKRNVLLSLMIIPFIFCGCGSNSGTAASSEASVEVSSSAASASSDGLSGSDAEDPDALATEPAVSSPADPAGSAETGSSVLDDIDVSPEESPADASTDASTESDLDVGMSIIYESVDAFNEATDIQGPATLDADGINRVSVVDTKWPTEYYAFCYALYYMGDKIPYVDYVINKNWGMISEITVSSPYIFLNTYLSPSGSSNDDITPELLRSGKKVYTAYISMDTGEITYLSDDSGTSD